MAALWRQDVGFSPEGLVVALAVLGPNLLLLRFPPRGPVPSATVPRPVGWLERAGQALCLAVPVSTAPGPLLWGWAVPVVTGLVRYYALWACYFPTGHAAAALYRPLGRIPVPMAVLPVVVLLATAAWMGNPWVAVAAVVLAAGHVPAALIAARSVTAAG
ncbi:hypothetical protein MF406_04485 [Georgenia sp. TF02-10]|uniref:hypothetical protein n=1 Tax=Georgenia sp. TF02-10 TaxID=2917725 RepID=UPI001FA7A566|nr:hypothetical protein [Georgenia sp. TF02-10]UNX55525.1 hypothetical protein MF406_04485 [Georgenia sp. TF02-10]